MRIAPARNEACDASAACNVAALHRRPRPPRDSIAPDQKSSTPDRIRTCDLRFRKPPLYPTELREPGARIAGRPVDLERRPDLCRRHHSPPEGGETPRGSLSTAIGTANLNGDLPEFRPTGFHWNCRHDWSADSGTTSIDRSHPAGRMRSLPPAAGCGMAAGEQRQSPGAFDGLPRRSLPGREAAAIARRAGGPGRWRSIPRHNRHNRQAASPVRGSHCFHVAIWPLLRACVTHSLPA